MQSVTTDFGLLFWQGINGFDKSDFDGILSMYLQLLDFGGTTIYGSFHNFYNQHYILEAERFPMPYLHKFLSVCGSSIFHCLDY
jgi:hypothetical protein